MKLLILPGYSPKNKLWAQEAESFLKNDFEVIIQNWGHWESGSFSDKKELESALAKIANEQVNILAKSIGTHIAMKILEKEVKINKLILCGIPSEHKDYNLLSKINPQSVIVFQNTKDPLSLYTKVKKFIASINPKIKVVEKPRSDHSYPFYEDFKNFLE